MKQKDADFYAKKSKEFKKYKFKDGSNFVEGEKPDFFKFLKKYSNKNFKVLDLGCGSGEFTIKIGSCFKEVVGVDGFEEYIKTAKENNNLENVRFIVADAGRLPFNDEEFDMVISSRGPLSATEDFMRESLRVLKKRGYMIEETIGEKDKMDLKKIFGRGQNYPTQKTKLESVKKMLDNLNLTLLEAKYYFYLKEYKSIDRIIKLLNRAPIIPDFDEIKDQVGLKVLERKLNNEKKIKLGFHRLQWVAKKA